MVWCGVCGMVCYSLERESCINVHIIYVCACVCACVSVCVCPFMCAYVHLCMFVCNCKCMFLCVCAGRERGVKDKNSRQGEENNRRR